jgi:hypothetical protein
MLDGRRFVLSLLVVAEGRPGEGLFLKLRNAPRRPVTCFLHCLAAKRKKLAAITVETHKYEPSPDPGFLGGGTHAATTNRSQLDQTARTLRAASAKGQLGRYVSERKPTAVALSLSPDIDPNPSRRSRSPLSPQRQGDTMNPQNLHHSALHLQQSFVIPPTLQPIQLDGVALCLKNNVSHSD